MKYIIIRIERNGKQSYYRFHKTSFDDITTYQFGKIKDARRFTEEHKETGYLRRLKMRLENQFKYDDFIIVPLGEQNAPCNHSDCTER